jgi:hypothetical protein
VIPMRRTWYVKPRGIRWSVIRQDGIYADSLHDSKDDAIAADSNSASDIAGGSA